IFGASARDRAPQVRTTNARAVNLRMDRSSARLGLGREDSTRACSRATSVAADGRGNRASALLRFRQRRQAPRTQFDLREHEDNRFARKSRRRGEAPSRVKRPPPAPPAPGSESSPPALVAFQEELPRYRGSGLMGGRLACPASPSEAGSLWSTFPSNLLPDR